jgi:membrane complex biogenesis BtpA family protein
MSEVLDRAMADTRVLTEAGFDGVLVENFMDVPFHPGRVPPVTVAAMTRAVVSASSVTELPLGVNVLRNDAAAALSIAVSTGASFVRVNVHTGAMWTDQGLVQGSAHETLRLRATLDAPVAILADVHVKHATPPPGADIATSARDIWSRGLADGLVVSGRTTGRPADTADLEAVRAAVPSAAVLVGSGLTGENAETLLTLAEGAIVGSSVMNEGRAGEGVDADRASALVDTVRRFGSS